MSVRKTRRLFRGALLDEKKAPGEYRRLAVSMRRSGVPQSQVRVLSRIANDERGHRRTLVQMQRRLGKKYKF